MRIRIEYYFDAMDSLDIDAIDRPDFREDVETTEEAVQAIGRLERYIEKMNKHEDYEL